MIFIKRHQEGLMKKKSKSKPFSGNKCTRCFLCKKTEDFVKKSKEHEKTCKSCDSNCNYCSFVDLSEDVINFKNDLNKKNDILTDINGWLKQNRMSLEKLLNEVKNSQIARAKVLTIFKSVKIQLSAVPTALGCQNLPVNDPSEVWNTRSLQPTTENFSTASSCFENFQHVQMVKSI